MTTLALHDYQVVARDFLRGRERAALFLDMGLGKTAATLSALEPRHLPVLVVAPKRVAENVWPAERDLWRPDLTLAVATGSPAERAATLAGGTDIVVLSRDNVGDLQVRGSSRPTAAPHGFRTVVLDELSGYKGRGVRWQVMRRVLRRPEVVYRWGLTGTPSPNSLQDLWAQVGLLDDGARFGRNFGGFQSRYFTPGRQIASGRVVGWELRPGADHHIHALLEDLALSMATDGRIELPALTYNDLGFALPPRARRAYDDLRRDLVADLRDVLGGAIHTAANAAMLTNRLSQVTAGFIFPDPTELGDPTPLHLDNVNVVKEVVESQSGPVLVFYRYVPQREMLLAAMSEARTIDEPNAIAAWNRGEVPVMVAHPQSAGHGLNLQHGGHTAVWASPTWSLEEWEQGNKRLHRQGQQHPVVVHSVLADGTIDSVVKQRLATKAFNQNALLAHLESPV